MSFSSIIRITTGTVGSSSRKAFLGFDSLLVFSTQALSPVSLLPFIRYVRSLADPLAVPKLALVPCGTTATRLVYVLDNQSLEAFLIILARCALASSFCSFGESASKLAR